MLTNLKPRIKRPSNGTVIAVIALFVALSGSATAAVVINGKQIKKGTISEARLSKALKKKLKSKSVNAAPVAGATGSTGPQGVRGPQGNNGSDGSPGPQGAKGDQGVKGEQGDTGDAGEQGPRGAKGSQGPAGATGPAGPTGPGLELAATFNDKSELISCGPIRCDEELDITNATPGQVVINFRRETNIIAATATLTGTGVAADDAPGFVRTKVQNTEGGGTITVYTGRAKGGSANYENKPFSITVASQ